MLRTPIIAGNWKMHMGPREAESFISAFLAAYPGTRDRTVALFPPAISLGAAIAAASGRGEIVFGVQNIHWEAKGAFTGETSAPMAAEAGARLVLVGHSERRHLFGETNEDTRRKVGAALQAGLSPVLCVGELLEEREAGRAVAVVEEQLRAVYEDLEAGDAARVVIAYEPVWAIGTGRTAAPSDAREMHAAVRGYLARRYDQDLAARIPILYGGSVKPENAAELLAEDGVDGLLVGGASLDPQGFARICAVPA
ncbi:MAG TPA: triose-phosphate isomerase [Longimicrobiaceae bacterium]